MNSLKREKKSSGGSGDFSLFRLFTSPTDPLKSTLLFFYKVLTPRARSRSDHPFTKSNQPANSSVCTYVCILCTCMCILCTYVCILCTYVCILCTYVCILCTYVCILCTYVCILCTYVCILCTCVYIVYLCVYIVCTYQIDLRMEANGVTPIPAPMQTPTRKRKMSCTWQYMRI